MSNEDKPTTVQDLSPQDQAKYAQIDTKVRDMHAEIGQEYDLHGPNISAGLLERYKAAELKGDVNGVCLSEANDYVKNGENVIGFVGPKFNPTNQTFYASSADLISTPAPQSLSQVLERDRNQPITLTNEKDLDRNLGREVPPQDTPSMGTRSNISS